MELFVDIFNIFHPSIIFGKDTILDIWQGSGEAATGGVL